MLKDVTLGQYFPGNSAVHRLDPRTKLLGLVMFIVALFMADNWLGFLLAAAFLVTVIGISKIPLKSVTKGLKPILFIMIFTGILNLFYTEGTHVIFRVWRITVTWEGVDRAVFMIVRIMLLIVGSFMLTYTTSPISLTDGLERLLSPLKKIRFPAHELSMMMCIALRFIPTLIEETDKIMSAQKARGADFESGSILRRAKAMVPILVPLFISAFRRADELATAMECRCYHGDVGRTKMKVLKFKGIDYAALDICVILIAGVVGLNLVPFHFFG